MAKSAMASIPPSSVTLMLCARITRLSTPSGNPAADDESTATSAFTRSGCLSAKRVAMPPPSERPPTTARSSPR